MSYLIIQFIVTHRACKSIEYTNKNRNAIRPSRSLSVTSVVAPVVPFATTKRRDATVKRKRSSTRYIIISIVDFATLRALPSPLPRWIPLARLFEIEQPCRGSCQNSSSSVKTSVFPSKQGTPSSTSPFRFFKAVPFFFFFLFFYFSTVIPLVYGFDLKKEACVIKFFVRRSSIICSFEI